MNNKTNYSDDDIVKGLIEGNKSILDFLKEKYFPVALAVASENKGTEQEADELIDCVISRIGDKIKKADGSNKKIDKKNKKGDKKNKNHETKKQKVDLIQLFGEQFNNNKFIKRCEQTWKTRKANEKIVNGMITNDPRIWKVLYDYFKPLAIKWVLKNSGQKQDAIDLLQDTFEAVFIKTINNTLPCDVDIMPYIMQIIKNKWIDVLRRRDVMNEDEFNDNHEDVDASENDNQNDEDNIDSHNDRTDETTSDDGNSMNSVHNQSNNFGELNHNDEISKIKDVLNDKRKTSETCRKVILLSFSSQYTNEKLAKILGYKNKETLASEKSRCMKKLRKELDIKNNTK